MSFNEQDAAALKVAHAAYVIALNPEAKTAGVEDVIGQLKDYWGGLDPDLKDVARNAGIGALTGGALGGFAGGDMGSALTGAFGGALAGGAGTQAWKLLSGSHGLPGEEADKRGLIGSAVGGAANSAISNPLTTLGLAGAGVVGLRGQTPMNAGKSTLEALAAMKPTQNINIGRVDNSLKPAVDAVDLLMPGNTNAWGNASTLRSQLAAAASGRTIDKSQTARAAQNLLDELQASGAQLAGNRPHVERLQRLVDAGGDIDLMSVGQAEKQLGSLDDQSLADFIKDKLSNRQRAGAGTESLLDKLKGAISGNRSGLATESAGDLGSRTLNNLKSLNPAGYNTEARNVASRVIKGNPYLKKLMLGGGLLAAGLTADKVLSGDI